MVADTQEKSENDLPIDWDHLARYTLGNKTVEREVLELFSRQSSQYLNRLKEATTQKAWREAAHTIKGSARGIGAWRVASKAEAIELIDEASLLTVKGSAVAELEQYIQEVLDHIQESLSPA